MARANSPEELNALLKQVARDLQVAQVQNAQRALGSKQISPVDTGRFRSSWFASRGRPSPQVAPEGTDAPSSNADSLSTTDSAPVHLTNSLPYAPALALGVMTPPSWGGVNRVVSKPATWFLTFLNSVMPRLNEAAAERIRAKHGL